LIQIFKGFSVPEVEELAPLRGTELSGFVKVQSWACKYCNLVALVWGCVSVLAVVSIGLETFEGSWRGCRVCAETACIAQHIEREAALNMP
jgi:hypothetical protein